MKKAFLTLAVPLFLCSSTVSDAAIPSSMSHTIDFRAVAKEGIPSVVSIRVSGNANSGLTIDSFMNDSRYEAFGDPFGIAFLDSLP